MMTSQEFSINHSQPVEPKRVVEAEFKLPTWEELRMPKVDLKPLRSVAEDILLTGLGAAVLLGRGMAAAVRAANKAGAEELEHPGPVTEAVLKLVRKPQPPLSEHIRMSVPVLPIDNYDARSTEEVLGLLPSLAEEPLRVLREYELAHARRTTVLKAIDQQLGVA